MAKFGGFKQAAKNAKKKMDFKGKSKGSPSKKGGFGKAKENAFGKFGGGKPNQFMKKG